MKGSIDNGQESVSLMKHGVGRSYTNDSGMSLRDEEENGSLPQRKKDEEHLDELDYLESDVPLLSQFHEDAIHQAGMGSFQKILLFITGLGLAADTTELFVVAYVIPSAEVEFCMSGSDKGWLAAITFLGMMIGAIIWGTLSDSIGRRRALLSALLVNAVFGLMTAFMPTYGIFMTTRFCSGIGIGGGIPIVFTYYCEFISRADRGRHLSFLLVFWAFGGVFTAVMAWIIIPRTGITVVLDEQQHHFSSWRVFLVVCSLPSFLAVFGLYFLPESPRFLLENGRDVEALMVYTKIHKWNNYQNPKSNFQLTELELPSGTHRPMRNNLHHSSGNTIVSDITYGFEKFWKRFYQLFAPPYLHTTIVLLILWFTSAFGFYGLSVWFPEYIKLLQSEEYEERAVLIIDKVYENSIFEHTRLDNYHFFNTIFNGVIFNNTVINHVLFENCSIFSSSFSDVRTSKTLFKNSYIAHNLFVDTDIYPYRFQQCEMINNSYRAMVPGCQLDFDYNIHYKDVFQENLIGQLTIIPGTLLASLVLDRLGRVKVMTVSLVMSAFASFFIWFLDSKTGVIIFEAIFNFIFIFGWNALDIATTEAYPAHFRTTAYGFLSATSRVAGILGSLCFGNFIYASRAIPMLTTSAILLVGGIVATKMVETKDALM